MIIRTALDTELSDVLAVERAAFGSETEANLVKELLADASATPCLSLLAFEDDQAVGHILFTGARLEPETSLSISILAPLAVLPNFHRRGIGGQLVKQGLQHLTESGCDLVFVLGHSEYYPHYGFAPAGELGFEATYPIPEEVADAWMVQTLREDVIGNYSGKVICANALNKPEYWRE